MAPEGLADGPADQLARLARQDEAFMATLKGTQPTGRRGSELSPFLTSVDSLDAKMQIMSRNNSRRNPSHPLRDWFPSQPFSRRAASAMSAVVPA